MKMMNTCEIEPDHNSLSLLDFSSFLTYSAVLYVVQIGYCDKKISADERI